MNAALTYGSVCSGIEAATVAWADLGWTPAFFAEIEKFPSAVLAHHYGSNMPDQPHATNGVPNYGDMNDFKEWPDHGEGGSKPIDLLVGGTPCQSFSIAGLRAGLADPRGNLMLTYLAVLARYRPRWCVWENVPGVLSSASHAAPDPRQPKNPMDMECDGTEVVTEDGYDAEELHSFGCLLAGLSELGYGFAYRVLDAQYCRTHGFEGAVPQRRRRVFVIGCLGNWAGAAQVLFDGQSLRGDPAPRRKAGQGATHAVAPSLKCSGTGVERAGDIRGQDPVVAARMVAFGEYVDDGSGSALKARDYKDATDLIALSSKDQGVSSRPRLVEDWAVRRLTPVECERLQGFGDNYTRIPWRNKVITDCPDGPRYKALGNSMAVNVMRIIGERIAAADAQVKALGAAA